MSGEWQAWSGRATNFVRPIIGLYLKVRLGPAPDPKMMKINYALKEHGADVIEITKAANGGSGLLVKDKVGSAPKIRMESDVSTQNQDLNGKRDVASGQDHCRIKI